MENQQQKCLFFKIKKICRRFIIIQNFSKSKFLCGNNLFFKTSENCRSYSEIKDFSKFKIIGEHQQENSILKNIHSLESQNRKKRFSKLEFFDQSEKRTIIFCFSKLGKSAQHKQKNGILKNGYSSENQNIKEDFSKYRKIGIAYRKISILKNKNNLINDF